MEFSEAVRRRHMTRSFSAQPLDAALVDRLVAGALAAPSAGNTGGTAWLVLEGPAETAVYWDTATTADWRARSRRFPGLSRAPVIALSLTSPPAYVARYGEPDKAASGLGPAGGPGAWPVPYWFGDAAFATMTLLLGAAAAGIGAAFLGNFRAEAELGRALDVPEGWRLFGAVLLGHPDGADHRSASLDRTPPAPGARLHRGRWGGPPRPDRR
jgi:nitroreductase